jgi:hypothetical protein
VIPGTHVGVDEVGAGYAYFENGMQRERLERKGEQITEFESLTRERSALPWQWPFVNADTFVTEHDAYFGFLDARTFFGNGSTVPFLDPGTRHRVNAPRFALSLGPDREAVSQPGPPCVREGSQQVPDHAP